MTEIAYASSARLRDLGWQTAYRCAYPLAKLWWRLRRAQHRGALVAVWVGPALLVLRSSYRATWNFPGGTVRADETPEQAVRRELEEEIGLPAATLAGVGYIHGLWDGRQDEVHFFELRLERLPPLRLDHREIVGARLVPEEELGGFALTGPVEIYLRDIRALATASR